MRFDRRKFLLPSCACAIANYSGSLITRFKDSLDRAQSGPSPSYPPRTWRLRGLFSTWLEENFIHNREQTSRAQRALDLGESVGEIPNSAMDTRMVTRRRNISPIKSHRSSKSVVVAQASATGGLSCNHFAESTTQLRLLHEHRLRHTTRLRCIPPWICAKIHSTDERTTQRLRLRSATGIDCAAPLSVAKIPG